jgi:DNA-directed RNA polymerase specialized sigma24 family protein
MEAEAAKASPSKEEVLKYAQGNIRKFIGQYAADLPPEIHEEIVQSANLRILTAYSRIKADKGWRSFVHNHCRGAVLDFIKFGKGFEESRWRAKLSDDPNAEYKEKLRERVTPFQDQDSDVDELAGLNGIADYIDENRIKIHWQLVARLSRKDDACHAFAMWLRGYDATEIAVVLAVSPARIGQLIREFSEMLADPIDDPMVNQMVYAFGLCKVFGMKEIDESLKLGFSVGWEQAPVDLDSLEPKNSQAEKQLGFFDAEEN